MTAKIIDCYEFEMIALFSHYLNDNVRFMRADHPAATILHGGKLIIIPLSEMQPGSESQKAVAEHLFAEVNIPFWQDDRGKRYVYTFHIFGLPHAVPAINEIMILKGVIAAVHQVYHERASPMGPIEVEIDQAEIDDEIPW